MAEKMPLLMLKKFIQCTLILKMDFFYYYCILFKNEKKESIISILFLQLKILIRLKLILISL